MGYVAVTVEGGLFPSDLLDRIATGQADGRRPQDFGLSPSRRLSDEIQGTFSDARSFWDAFQRRLAHSSERSTTLTREAWIMPLLELLGFDLLFQRSAAQIGSDSYFISHRAGDDLDAPPVHIVAIEQPLDRKAEGFRRSPHALVQEYLNRSDALWGMVTNGERLRLLRDSARLARPTYLEFDLRAMVEGNLYSEFVVLYRVLHRSRFPRGAEDAHECWLERYYQQGIDEGGRVRDGLRDGVEEALRVLGNAFLAHPESEDLRRSLSEGRLDSGGYYRQLLRLVYRLLFLMVAEERRLIFPPSDGSADLQNIYTHYYSVSRLRDRCERYFAEDRYSDLWQGLLETFRLFRDEDSARKLGLGALGGELFGPDACADIEGAACQNRRLLEAMFRLSTFSDDHVRRRVNYAGLDVEELGSVYESLLEFQPVVRWDGSRPVFEFAEGTERRSTGSYYTAPELVRELVEHALVPVMEDRLARLKTREEKEKALLNLNVCDPASGSGHFLLAAARRMARELARVRTGEEEPTPEAYRLAVRDVIANCIYAVDKNPLAVDLCKVALWIEGHNRGLPLTFLDHRIKLGDSLVGVADLKVLEEGIPDEAFHRTDSSQKTVAKVLRDRNRVERQGQLSLVERELDDHLLDVAAALDELQRMPEDSPRQVVEKARRYERSREANSDWWVGMTACHMWTAPFFTELKPGDTATPTTGTLRRFLSQPKAVDGRLVGQVWGLATTQGRPFFHWPLEFPDVFMGSGFDVVLSNPPFMGGIKISGRLGDHYRNYLTAVFAPAGAQADLCTYFYRRAFELLRPGGHLGMVATNTIGQGDTREGGLAVIVNQGGTVTFARRFIKWPGAANVEVNLLAIRQGPWNEDRLLDNELVPYVSSRLDDQPETEPTSLCQNRGKAFQGQLVRGIGFALEPEEAHRLIAKNRRNRECLLPYLDGEDINTDPEQRPSRCIINFFDWPLDKAEQYPDLIRIVEERVKPYRLGLPPVSTDYRKLRALWWRFARSALDMHEAIEGLPRVLVRAQVSDHHMMVFVAPDWVYSHKVIVFGFDDDYHFALLQSSVHEIWVRKYTSTLRITKSYSPTDCFGNFPFPQEPTPGNRDWAAHIGTEYQEHRRQVMLARSLGLTKTYNLFNKPECQDEDIVRLRELHAEMDRAILACYGWQDLDPAHGFHQNERGQTRYTVSPEARREILRRLLELNLRVAEEEAKAAAPASPRARRQPAMRQRQGKNERMEGLVAQLRSRRLEVIDDRSHGGHLWVVGGKELFYLLTPRGLIWGPGGAPATGNRAGWYLPKEPT